MAKLESRQRSSSAQHTAAALQTRDATQKIRVTHTHKHLRMYAGTHTQKRAKRESSIWIVVAAGRGGLNSLARSLLSKSRLLFEQFILSRLQNISSETLFTFWQFSRIFFHFTIGTANCVIYRLADTRCKRTTNTEWIFFAVFCCIGIHHQRWHPHTSKESDC